MIDKKIDFMLLVTVKNANPNGDPVNNNYPRVTELGYGEISDVCIKRKLRNRLQALGAEIFVQTKDSVTDGYTSLQERFENDGELAKLLAAKKGIDVDACVKRACERWYDVRAFGAVFAYGKGFSANTRGAVSIQLGESVSPVTTVEMSITKSCNGVAKEGDGKSSDTMGTKKFVEFGLYTIKGSISCEIANKNGLTKEDIELLKKSLLTLFEGDATASRPEGSMEVVDLFWWTHKGKTPTLSSAKVFRSVHIDLKDELSAPKDYNDYVITVDDIGVDMEHISLY